VSIAEDTRPNVLMVDKDWGSSVIWVRGRRGGMANCTSYDRFGFPDWLVRRLDLWSAWYGNNDPSEISKTLDWELWEGYGLALAVDVKRIVGDKYVVSFGTRREIPYVPFDPDWLPPRDGLDKAGYAV